MVTLYFHTLRGIIMRITSLFRKNKKVSEERHVDAAKVIVDAAVESVTAYRMMEKDKQEGDVKEKRNIVFQPEHVIVKANRAMMTKGVPAEYFFEGDAHNKSKELALRSPLKINIEKALKEGVPGAQPRRGSGCAFIAETDEYRFYNYGCYSDGGGGCTIAQKKSKPKQALFFGKSKHYTCIFHNKLMQIDSIAHGTGLYLFVKDIDSGKEQIYPWFGKYAIPTGWGSRYDQDRILDMRVDADSDSVIIEVQRRYYINPALDDSEAICNADTTYTMTVKDCGAKFRATADFPELNVSVIFED